MSIKYDAWSIIEDEYIPEKINHSETIFTIGNGFLSTRGTFEEYANSEVRSTFLHGVFDDVPVFFTELANTPDWTELEIFLNHERFSMDGGKILNFERRLDLKNASLRRKVRWESAKGMITTLGFERFVSLEDSHLCGMRIEITPENYDGVVEIRSGLNGNVDNLGYKHWDWHDQGTNRNIVWLSLRTHSTLIELTTGLSFSMRSDSKSARIVQCDVHNHPSLASNIQAKCGETITAKKWVTCFSSRESKNPFTSCIRSLKRLTNLDWDTAYFAHSKAWQKEWDLCDVIIEGDLEAQLAIRFNIFQLLIAAPRSDEHVNIGAKTLSGYGYRGHSFWDTEIFMLPFFTFTRPEIARNLLSYRWHNLPGARKKAIHNGFKGAQYPWESADAGEEVTPTWISDPKGHAKLIRIWTGDIEIHISADISFAIWQYWKISHDEKFLFERGSEVILETARFWAARAEWHTELQRFAINDVIGPDEYHEHVNDNVFTNALARWNLQTATNISYWLKTEHPLVWKQLRQKTRLDDNEIEEWKHVIDNIYLPFDPETHLVEQFEGYFDLRNINLEEMEPRTESVQSILGIEGVGDTQVIKQPDVLMLMYLFPELYDQFTIETNYAYYTPRTDHAFGSSLGPSIQAIMGCRVGDPAAYVHFLRAARADLFDVRNNTGDGIHGASAGGLWQAVIFGFAGLESTSEGWKVNPHLPKNWKRLAFQIVDQGKVIKFDI